LTQWSRIRASAAYGHIVPTARLFGNSAKNVPDEMPGTYAQQGLIPRKTEAFAAVVRDLWPVFSRTASATGGTQKPETKTI
jgi:hypothetical protein